MAHILAKILVAMILFPAVAHSATSDNDRFYRETDKPGYYWYKDPKEEEKVEPDPKKPLVVAPKEKEAVKERKLLDLADYTPEALWNMYPDDFQTLMDDFKKQSVQTLSEKDVYAYYYMQDIARRKAAAYVNVHSVVMMKNPQISLEGASPQAVPGKLSMGRGLTVEKEDSLKANKENYGLVLFVSPKCPLCVEQEKIIQYFVNVHGWEFRTIDIKKNPHAAKKFNITVTPTIIVAKRNSENYMPLGYGVIALNTFKDRLYGSMRMLSGEAIAQDFYMKGSQKGGAYDTRAPLSGSKK